MKDILQRFFSLAASMALIATAIYSVRINSERSKLNDKLATHINEIEKMLRELAELKGRYKERLDIYSRK